MDIGGLLIAVALFAIGYFPMHRLKTPRAAIIGALAGVALFPLALALIRAYESGAATTPAVLIFLFWLIPVSIAMVLGAIVRLYTVNRQGLSARDRWAIAILDGIGLFILMTALARALLAGLD